MRVISLNVNGIRSAAKKGFFSWMTKQDADVVCLQEVRAHDHQLNDEIFQPKGYVQYSFPAQKPGYSGVSIYCKQEPKIITQGLGWEVADEEGRYIEADFGKICIASLYMPSGTSGDARQAVKYEFMDHYIEILKKQRASKKHYIICGDWNIAHKTMDLKNWRGNQKSSGFLPEERAWMDVIMDEIGFVDAFRYLHPTKEQYTWWSARSKTAWENNIGWRIDYQIISPELAKKISAASVYREQKFSDHAPVIVDYDL